MLSVAMRGAATVARARIVSIPAIVSVRHYSPEGDIGAPRSSSEGQDAFNVCISSITNGSTC